MIIAVDGPAASGKGTLARRLAEHYDLAYLDTGSLYRSVAYEVLSQGAHPTEVNATLIAAKALTIGAVDDTLLRTAEVGVAASLVAAQPELREAIKELQRRFAQSPPGDKQGAVLDGRDIGTVICPNADVKLFIEASAEVRAERRASELNEKNPQNPVTKTAVLTDLNERDARDRSRKISPLLQAEDAHLLDTTNLSIEAAFQAACTIIDQV
jgi:cytidylate kinase